MTGLPPALASRQRRSIIADATSGLGMSRGAHISIRGNRFRLINAAGNEFLVPTAHLDVIVVDANVKTSKVYFENEYDPNSDVPPTCFSDNGTGPSTQSMAPQAPTCAACPWNIIGSDTSKVTGRGIKACSDRKKVAIIIPDDPQVNVYELQIPPGSLTNLRAYSQWLGQQASGVEGRALDIADMVTRLEFDPNKMGVLQFRAVAYADDDHTMKLIEYIDANRLADVAVGRNDVAHDPEMVKQLLAGRPQPVLQAPAPAAPAPQAQPFALPPRQQEAPAQLPPPAAAPAPVPKTRKPRTAAAAPAGTPQFMAPAASANAQPQLPPQNLDVPPFLRRDANNALPTPPTPKFGMVDNPPAPPPGVAEAMALPTRRA